MSARHTSGPWQSIGSHESEGFNCYWINAQPNSAMRGFTKEIAAVTGPQGGEAEANARLIAAAPELLEALQGLANALEATPGPRGVMELVPSQLENARAVIRKARGE